MMLCCWLCPIKRIFGLDIAWHNIVNSLSFTNIISRYRHALVFIPLQQLARDPTVTDILRQQFEFTKDVRALQQLLVFISLSLNMFWFYRRNNHDLVFNYLNDYTLVSFIFKMLNILSQPSNVCWVLWDDLTVCKTIV